MLYHLPTPSSLLHPIQPPNLFFNPLQQYPPVFVDLVRIERLEILRNVPPLFD